MAKPPNPRNRSEWQKRLERYRSSDLTIVRFCQHEKVTTSAFHYWAKRLQQEGQVPTAAPADPGRRRSDSTARRPRKQVATALPQPSSSSGPPATVPMVQFAWNTDLRVSIPAHCLDAIRSVLEWSRECVDESSIASGKNDAFQQVLVGPR